jgi:iron complex outermembrane receptor protein
VLRARFDTPVNFVGGVGAVPAGNTPPNVPRRLANLSSQWQLAPGWRVGAQAQWVGQRQANVSNSLQLDAYRTLDAWLQWQAASDHSLTLRIKNATDALPAVWASTGFGQTNLIYGDPRRVELSWSARW